VECDICVGPLEKIRISHEFSFLQFHNGFLIHAQSACRCLVAAQHLQCFGAVIVGNMGISIANVDG